MKNVELSVCLKFVDIDIRLCPNYDVEQMRVSFELFCCQHFSASVLQEQAENVWFDDKHI